MRVSAYIDGFNFYHRLSDLSLKTGESLNQVDYQALLFRLFVDDPELAQLGMTQLTINLFTAHPVHKSLAVQQRHMAYIEALRKRGVRVFEGFFQMVEDSHNERRIVREKQSDVALGVAMVCDAARNQCDLSVLMSRDTDFAPALKAIRRYYPGQGVTLVTPPNARKYGELMKWTTLTRRKTHAALLRLCQLPETATPCKIETNAHLVENLDV